MTMTTQEMEMVLVLWDDDDFGDEDDNDIMEEACIGNDYNLRSKGVVDRGKNPSQQRGSLHVP